MYKLLIVDDEAIERDAVRFILDKSDLEFQAIEEASNGQEAISTAALFQPDIIMMDIKMPGLDGIESSKIIKKIKEETKIIFLTAFDEFEHAKEGIKIGIEDFVVKPATNERIIEVLKNAMKLLDKEKRERENQAQIEEKLKQVTGYLETEFLNSVIAGDLTEDQLKEYVEFMNIRGECGFGFILMLHYNEENSPSNLQRNMQKKRILEKLRKALERLNRQHFVTHVKDSIHILVIDEDRIDVYNLQDKLKNAIIDLAEEVLNEYDVYIDFGIGDVKEKIEDLWQSFSFARESCQKKTYTKRDEATKDRLHNLVRCVVECDEERLAERIEELYDTIAFKAGEMDSLKVKLYEYLVLFNQAVYTEIPVALEDSEVMFRKLMALETMQEGKVYLREYVMMVLQKVQTMKSDKTVVIMDKLITYINNHYNENITLEMLSEMSGFSLHYLSKVFKKHLDMNFSEYLSFIRIKVAKRRLQNPENSVKEISMEVGYTDPNYFARVFRKFEHMTPTEYRNRHMKI